MSAELRRGFERDLQGRLLRPLRRRRGRRARVVAIGSVFALACATSLGLGAGCRSPGSRGGGDGSGESVPAERDAEATRSIEAVALALRPVDAWSGSFMLRQRVRVAWPSGDESFDAVLQRRPGELALIGLGPMNLVGFRLALIAGAPTSAGEGAARIEFENRSGRALPFSAAHMLADVQRVFYPWLAEPWPSEASASGPDPDRVEPAGVDCPEGCERSGRQGAVAVWERRVAGRLAERRFAIVGRLDAGEVRIRYADWQGEPAMPRRVELENGWFGYRLTIETLEATALPDR
jgi:hypothetical protein